MKGYKKESRKYLLTQVLETIPNTPSDSAKRHHKSHLFSVKRDSSGTIQLLTLKGKFMHRMKTLLLIRQITITPYTYFTRASSL